MNAQIRYAAAGILVALLVLGGFFVFYWLPHQPVAPTDVHLHADLMVYLDGNQIDFSQSKYQSDEDHHLSERVHFHDGDGNVFHVHAAQVTLGELFESLGIRFTADCFVTDENIPYCDGPQGQLKFFVNDQSNTQFDAYIPKDLDRILIAYGNESPVQLRQELDAVTDNACIPSGKCLERGSPPDESSCTTQNGCVATGPLRAE